MGSDSTNKMLRAAGAAKARQLLLEDPAFSVVEKRGTGHGHGTVRLNVDYVLTHAPDEAEAHGQQDQLLPQQQQQQQHQEPQQTNQHQRQAQQLQLQLQAVGAGVMQHSAHLPNVLEMHPQKQQDGSYSMLLAELSGQGGAGDNHDTNTGHEGAEDLTSLLNLLPQNHRLREMLAPYTRPGANPFLVDIAADLGRPISLRLSDKSCVELPLSLDLDQAQARLQQLANSRKPRRHLFSDTNRLGLPGSLHRISAMRDNTGDVYGITYRVGRQMPGVAHMLADVLSSMRDAARGAKNIRSGSLVPSIFSQRSQGLLLLGRPGMGKTTLLRDVARLISIPEDQGGLGMSVVIIDTSNEIAGDSKEPHPCIGNARRMMVPRRHQQAAVMIEAVSNHTPEVVIVDEIATKEEALACRTIATRGVLLVSTAHGSCLSDLLSNPDLRGLVGGVRAVTLGDKRAREENKGSKTRLERGGAVTFGSMVELTGVNRWRLHPDVAASVDCLLANSQASGGSSTTDLELGPQTPPGADTQLRSKSGAQMLVSFESERVPATARWLGGWEPPAAWTALPQPQWGLQQQQQQQHSQPQQQQQQDQQQQQQPPQQQTRVGMAGSQQQRGSVERSRDASVDKRNQQQNPQKKAKQRGRGTQQQQQQQQQQQGMSKAARKRQRAKVRKRKRANKKQNKKARKVQKAGGGAGQM